MKYTDINILSSSVSVLQCVPVKTAGLKEKMDGDVDRGHPGLEFLGDRVPSEGTPPPAGSWLFSFLHLSRASRRRSSFWEDSCTRV